jgi:hypothetical protein
MITNEKTSRPDAIPFLSGKELSRNSAVRRLMYDIKNLISCPHEIYTILYRTTLWNVAELCQMAPYSEKEFNGEYGFLIRQLTLAMAALKLRRGILFPKNAGAESIASEEAQWTYAVFSGSLVKNLSQLQENGAVIRWQLQKNIKRDVFMAALSEHIFPTIAVNWLSSNTNLFKLWWDVILHQPADNNDIESIIQLAGKKIGINV